MVFHLSHEKFCESGTEEAKQIEGNKRRGAGGKRGEGGEGGGKIKATHQWRHPI